MQIVNMREAKAQFAKLVERAAAGEVLIVAKSGKPAARLGPLDDAPNQRKLGWLQGQINAPDDIKTPFSDEMDALFGGQADKFA